jgi:hypothetical protein
MKAAPLVTVASRPAVSVTGMVFGAVGATFTAIDNARLLPRTVVSFPRPPASVSLLSSAGTEEKGYFAWFKCRTASKLPGSFICCFWNKLLFQASLNEPAVLHAVLALSSVHKSGIINAEGNDPNEQEYFTLQHYVKSISHLQPHFATQDRASSRVALITCVVFVCLELLRGHFKTAQIHLQNGLKILEEMQILSNADDGILGLKHCRESADEWIVEAFSRLHLQVELSSTIISIRA